LYLSDEEMGQLKIPSKELWRVVRFEVREAGWISWLHEREWRGRGNFALLEEPFRGACAKYQRRQKAAGSKRIRSDSPLCREASFP
jgi:hypothetical protein